MKISGFTYVRNGFDYSVPFLESIQSILPICHEFIVILGDSSDGTQEAIEALNEPKIKIIHSVWDMSLRKGGKVFAQQANLGLDHITGDWAFHIQADEVMHEDSLPILNKLMQKYNDDEKVDGFLFPFIHFWGDYNHVRNTRRVHPFEIRLFKNNKLIRSYRDSQGFRKYNSLEQYQLNEKKGSKLNVIKTDTPVFHYNGIRTPEELYQKQKRFDFYYNPSQIDVEKNNIQGNSDLHKVDRVTLFEGKHPKVMAKRIENFKFIFNHDTAKAKWKLKDKIVQPLEDFLGIRFFGYKNYKLLKD